MCSAVYELPLLYNLNLEIYYKRQWANKVVILSSDIVDSLGVPMSLQEFTRIYSTNTNFWGMGQSLLKFYNYFDTFF